MKINQYLLSMFVFTISISAFAAPPPYTGKTQNGWVMVLSGGNALSGHMKVRFTPSPGHEQSYIHCGHTANSSVACSAYDAASTTSFSCSIPTTSGIYSQAVDIVNNLTDGSYLYISKNGTSCTSIYMAKASQFQH